jgi:GTP-binding protein
MSNTDRALRNIAIIAHVDHGKTTLVDQLLRQSGTFRENQQVDTRVMDSNDLEKERGITILAKNCAVEYKGTHINIVDTPGHADFGGEVERVLSMVDSVLLLVDAVEGPMPQTRFVTRKALALGLKPIVVVNKIDRPGARPEWVINATFELFDKLGATEEQLDFPVVFASALNGYASLESDVREGDMTPLFDAVLRHVPCVMMIRTVRCSCKFPRLIIHLMSARSVSAVSAAAVSKRLQDVVIMNGPEGTPVKARINQVLKFKGLEREIAAEAWAGDIVLINGIEELGIGTTVCAPLIPPMRCRC